MWNIFLIQTGIIRIMLGIGPRSSCRGELKKLHILTVPSLYMHFETNSPIHSIDKKKKSNTLTISEFFFNSNRLCHFSSIQIGCTYSLIKILNQLPLNISKVHRDSITSKSTLKEILCKECFLLNR